MRIPERAAGADARRWAGLSRPTPARALVVAAAALAGVQACTSVDVVGVQVGSVEVAPGAPTITAGAVRQFSATVRDEDGALIPGAQVTWSVDEPAVAEIDQSGLATGLTAGTTDVRATFQGTSGRATLTVQAPNSAPTAAITAPADGSSFTQGNAITFTGTGTDPEDGALSGSSLAWSSQIDGAIGTGTSFATSALSLGTHIITLRATDSDGATATTQIGLTVVRLAAPTVTSITPGGGNTAGGTPVTITGTGFVSGATVRIGGVAATDVVVVGPTSITATTGARAAGTVGVVVTNPDTQTGTLVGGYTYAPAPTVTSITPHAGPTAGGTAVTIAGTGFVAGSTVRIGGTPATNVVVVSATSITATTPGHAAGAVSVAVTNPGAQTATLPSAFTYLPGPSVTSITPNAGSTAGGTPVTIAGTGFVSGATVRIGGVAATDVVVVGPTSITATTGARAAGTVGVVVTNPDTQTGTLVGGYTYAPAPTVASVSPNSGPTAGGTPVTITGTGFVVGATVTIGGVAATNVGFVSATSLTALTPVNPAGAADVVVTNPDAQTDTLVDGFTYVAPIPAPTVTSISPDSGTTAGGTSVTITGTNFVAGATVTIGTVAATGVVFNGPTSLTATTGARVAGRVNIVVRNPDGQTGTLSNGFTYVPPAPTVTSVSPNTGPTAGGTSITITGTNFVAVPTVTIGGVAATSVGFFSSTSITATTPAGAAGAVDVVVRNPDAQADTLTDGFTYVAPAPTVTSISPDTGPEEGGTSVTITGTNFVDEATVTIGGVAATDVTFNSPTSITATTPPGAAGAVAVVVTNPDTQFGTLPGGFTYN